MVVVDVAETATARCADTFLRVPPGGDFELIWALRAQCAAWRSHASRTRRFRGPASNVSPTACAPAATASVFFGLGLTRHGIAHANVEALLRLVTDTNAHARFVARRMRIPAMSPEPTASSPGKPATRSASTWHAAIRATIRASTAPTSCSNAAKSMSCCWWEVKESHNSRPAAQRVLQQLPTIVLDYPTTDCSWQPHVQFTTAIYGVHRPGTAYRMDEVPIPLQQILTSPLPADHEVLEALREGLVSLRS